MAVLFHFGCGLWCGSQLILLRDRGKKRTLRSSRTEQHMAHLCQTLIPVVLVLLEEEFDLFVFVPVMDLSNI